MCGGVVLPLHGIARARKDRLAICSHHDGTYGHLARRGCLVRLLQRQPHESLVAGGLVLFLPARPGAPLDDRRLSQGAGNPMSPARLHGSPTPLHARYGPRLAR